MKLIALLHLLRGRKRAPAPETPVAPAGTPAETAWGCGWFDSSHELRHGLSVLEHADAERLGAEMPLGPWLDLHLSGWRPGVGG